VKIKEMKSKFFKQLLILAATLGMATTAFGQSAWVSDQFEVMLRTGPSTANAIQLMVDSGTELQILGEDADAGYTQVRTSDGIEGWMLSRYLMNERSARRQLITLTQQLTDVTSDSSGLGIQLSTIRGEHDEATRQIRQLQHDKERLQSEVDAISAKAANTLAIDRQNQDLQQQLTAAEIKVSTLEQENDTLESKTARYWFLAGALVLIVGIVLGLILPRMKFQKRSRYDSF
jgi:SH3 domain protein